MGKMLNGLILIVLLEIAMFAIAGVTYSGSGILEFLLKPLVWNDSNWLSWIIIGLQATATTAIIVGTIVSRSDWVWRLGIIVVFITYMAIIFQFFTWLRTMLDAEIGIELYEVAGVGLSAGGFIAFIVTFPMILYYLTICYDFVSGKD